MVDRLLASPRYGERWGRHWLDVARYADSNGLDENLVYRHAYRYRDYVIQAFNKDKPYDLFVKEQLAGDLLPGPVPDAVAFERWTATGFLSLGAKMLAEDDPVKMEMDIVDEQLDTTARTFMGLTVGCARCHDHKFDPIPQADYYSLAGIFKSSKTMENFKVVAHWHEYVLAPEAEREKAEGAQGQDRSQEQRDRPDLRRRRTRQLIARSARATSAPICWRRTTPFATSAFPAARRGRRRNPADAMRRAAGSFDRGNAPRTLEKEKPNVPKGAKGPFFAEYDFTVAGGGRLPVRLPRRRGRRRHGGRLGERRPGAARQASGGESRGIAGRGRLERGGRVSAEGREATRSGWNTNRASRTSKRCW